jgi:hypothetical protein
MVNRQKKHQAMAGIKNVGVAAAPPFLQPPLMPLSESCFVVCSYSGVYSVGSGFINPLFDSQKVLLRRIAFLHYDRTKCVFVGVYPARDYEALLKFGAVNKHPSS